MEWRRGGSRNAGRRRSRPPPGIVRLKCLPRSRPLNSAISGSPPPIAQWAAPANPGLDYGKYINVHIVPPTVALETHGWYI